MIRKLEKVVIAFPTTTDVMDMECICKERGSPGRVIPIPGAITADCGLAWRCEPSLRGQVEALADPAEVMGIYQLEI